jgi:hypothetical protein
MVRDHSQEFFILLKPNSRIFRDVTACDFRGRIGAAVINDSAIPVLISLRQNAFDALHKVLSAVVDGDNYAY